MPCLFCLYSFSIIFIIVESLSLFVDGMPVSITSTSIVCVSLLNADDHKEYSKTSTACSTSIASTFSDNLTLADASDNLINVSKYLGVSGKDILFCLLVST